MSDIESSSGGGALSVTSLVDSDLASLPPDDNDDNVDQTTPTQAAAATTPPHHVSSSSRPVVSFNRALLPPTTTKHHHHHHHSSPHSRTSDGVGPKIFSLLDLRSKKTARLVCKRWRSVIDKSLVSFHIELTDFTYTYVENFGPTRPVRELLVGFLSVPYPTDGWNLHRRVQSLSILSDFRFQVTYRASDRPVLDHNGVEIKSLHAPNTTTTALNQHQPSLAMVVMSEAKLERLFNEFKHVRKLTVSSMALADVKDNSFLASVKLHSLREVQVSQEWDHGLCGVRDLLSNVFPRLRTIQVYINCDDDLTLYAEVFQFVGRHGGTVTALQLSFLRASLSHHADPNNNENDGTQIVNVNKDHKLDHVVYADLLRQLGTVRLRDLQLHALSTEGILRNNLELHLLSCQCGLVVLHLTNLRAENMSVWRRVPLVIEACSRTLKTIILDGCFCECDRSHPAGPFPGSWVKSCRKLETLEVLLCGIKVKGITRIPPKVKKLCLGHVLTVKQIRTVLSYFKNLEELALPQSHAKNTPPVYATSTSTSLQSRVNFIPSTSATTASLSLSSKLSVVSLSHFKMALGLPSLRKLTLLSKTCRYTRIRRYAAGLIGVVENPVAESVFSAMQQMKAGALKRGDVEFVVDRNVFEMDEEEEEEEDEEELSSRSSSRASNRN